MSNRSAISVAALFASILAGANLTSVTDIRAQTAADNCLTAPKDKTPAGSHWYYRLERGTKRQCWYLRDENDKSARAAPQATPAEEATEASAAEPAAPPPRPAVRKSVANAHAEFPPAQQRVEQQTPAAAEPPTAGTAPAMPPQTNPAASLLVPATPSSTVATRWPDASAATAPTPFRTVTAEPQPAPAEVSQAEAPPVSAPVALTTTDSLVAKQSASMQMLFLVMAGALTLAGIIASLIFRFGGARARARRLEIRRDRRAIWNSIHHERPSPPMQPDDELPVWRREELHDPRAPDDPQRRATEMLARLARSAQN